MSSQDPLPFLAIWTLAVMVAFLVLVAVSGLVTVSGGSVILALLGLTGVAKAALGRLVRH